MPTYYNNLPQVRRKEIDVSDVAVAQIGNTIGTVIRSSKGPIKRPVLVTDAADFVNTFGAPVFTSGTTGGTDQVVVPEYGYGSYAVLQYLNETSSVLVVRDYDNGDVYASQLATINSSSKCVSAMWSGDANGFVPTDWSVGDPFDSNTFISTIETSGAVYADTDKKDIVFAYRYPSELGNNVAVVVELPSLSADWVYKYDEYPVGNIPMSMIWNSNDTGTPSLSACIENFPIASNMVKVLVYTKPNNKSWDEMFATTSDKTAGLLRISPVETWYGTFNDAVDADRNSLFIMDVVNANSKYVYIKTKKTYGVGSPVTRILTTDSYTKPYGSDAKGAYVKRSSLIELKGGNSKVATGLSSTDMWKLFENRRQIDVDILGGWSWNVDVKQTMAGVAGGRGDCFAELQSNPPTISTSTDIIDNEKYGYVAPSYVGLNAGFSKVFDSYNNKDVYLPNSIFGAVLDLRVLRSGRPWDVAAGTQRGILPVTNQQTIYDDSALDLMAGANINPVSYEKGYGFCMWGQRTAQLKKSALDRKNVRFNLLYIENNIETFLKQFIFELNTQQTRLRAWTGVDEFLAGVKASGGLYAYNVVCDESNNTPAVIDSNQMNLDCYVQCTKAAEIINFTTVVTRTGASLNSVKLQYA